MSTNANLEKQRSEVVMVQQMPYNAEAAPEGLFGSLTETRHHYVRSNFAIPEYDGKLHIDGSVESPYSLTLDDLKALPAVEHIMTMECAGNGRLEMKPMPIGEPWGDYAVSTARWKGARFADVLAAARPKASGVDVVFEGADHGPYYQYDDISFIRALKLDLVSDPAADIIIAYEMNGEPLKPDHGAPFRLIVPRWFGVASVKWLKKVTVIDKPYVGEFQTAHYMYEWQDRPHTPVDIMQVRARITHPHNGETLKAGPVVVRGKAWSGHGPITKVEVSATGEGEWFVADVSPQVSPYGWQDWSLTWNVERVARHTLRARATDSEGNTQPDSPPWNRLGYGNNAVEVIFVDIR